MVCSDKVKKSYVSEEIAPGDGGRGWLDFIKSNEVVRDLSTVASNLFILGGGSVQCCTRCHSEHGGDG